jgi:hypothetical protein
MKQKASIIALWVIFLVSFGIRVHYYKKFSTEHAFSHITYDAFGYYMYLPSAIIYGDMRAIEWIEPMHQQYGVKGGDWLYQTIGQPDGRHTFKYFSGVALMQLPFFLMAHALAPLSGYPPDGFSLPYQWGIIASSFFYAFLGLWLLRRLLRYYFSDVLTALVLLLITLASNWVQYLSVDGAQSHIYIFPLYALILLLSKKWHESPTGKLAFAIGWVIGMATISRPTEAVMLFIPLLWGTQTPEAARAKWAMVRANIYQVGIAVIGGITGILPQLLYWKYSTGSFIYNTGSKWYFLNPWFRVLFGFEKGWFIYTPVTFFFVLGFWFMRNRPFQRSVLVFCLLNLWIIMAWSDWRYGGSYAARALVQSYPVFALAFACFIEKIWVSRWKPLVLIVSSYLLLVNLLQIYQYNEGIIRYDENTFEHYKSIYLNPWAK